MKRVTLFLFLAIFLLSACASPVCGVPIYPEDAETTAFPVNSGSAVAARINSTVPLSGFEIRTGEGSESDASLTLELYAFNGTYTVSAAASPLQKAEFTGVGAGEWLFLQTRELPAGEYLLVVTAQSDGITFEKTAGKSDLIDFYYAGSSVNDGAFPFRLIYQKEKAGDFSLARLLAAPGQAISEE